MALVRVGSVRDIPEGEGRGFDVEGRLVAVFNVGSARFYATEDVCSHAYSLLSEGEVDVDDLTVECPRHGSTFELESGRPTTLPATVPVKTFPVKVEGDDILIEVTE
ncbi:MAG: non-heme iron oxygenase ferredoxin subunit [Actinobacteria bacterium]|nr:non-heme iron oxygenase ferredoxin subunit [Actinomycetota bacterium]